MTENVNRVTASADQRPPSRPFVVHERDCDLEDWSASGRNGVSWRTLLSADRTPTDSLTMGIAEIEPGSPDEFHLHRHEPAEAYYILAGTGAMSIDGEVFDVGAGSAVFVPGDSIHAIANTGSDVLRLLYVFGVDSFDDVTYVFPD
jgi:mannose-6-phosphate isomerase-like protein (cupin superfamily)